MCVHVFSGAVGMLEHQPINASVWGGNISKEWQVAMALNNGTDIEMGDTLYYTYMAQAIKLGLTSQVLPLGLLT